MVYFKYLKASALPIFSIPAIVIVATPALATVYLNLAEVQQLIFPGEQFTRIPLSLSKEQRQWINEKSASHPYFNRQEVWGTGEGGYLFVDEVIGKHERITFAVGINPDGSIRQVEIMEYREVQGNQIRQKKWRKQFVGKTSQSAVALNQDIKNISGATLSCRHVTEGVKRILAIYELILKK